jgi:hypothetical protein
VNSKLFANIKKLFLFKNQLINQINLAIYLVFGRFSFPPYDPNQFLPYTALLVSHCVVLTLKSES